MFVLIMKLLQHFRLRWPHPDDMKQRYNILLIPDRDAAIQLLATVPLFESRTPVQLPGNQVMEGQAQGSLTKGANAHLLSPGA